MSSQGGDTPTPSAGRSKAYKEAMTRSGGHCEAVRELAVAGTLIHVRCGRRPVQTHHRVTRARGGHLLDEAGESRHLMILCVGCHNEAHDQASAFINGLLIEGSVVIENERPVYRGPDEYLSKEYSA